MGHLINTRPITRDDIISELTRNVEAGTLEVRYPTPVPCVFNVYLHPEDFEQIRPAGVSREHCRIRRDPATGKFSIKDVSQYGATVDGQRIPTSLERAADGSKIDRNVEAPLPARAKAGLADVFFLEFETVQPE